MHCRHQWRRATRPISTCRTTAISGPAGYRLRPPLPVSAPSRRRQLRLTINSKPGRALCFLQGHSSSAVSPRAKVRRVRMRIDCKGPASSAHIRWLQVCVTILSSCADRLSGGRNDWLEHGSHDFASWRANRRPAKSRADGEERERFNMRRSMTQASASRRRLRMLESDLFSEPRMLAIRCNTAPGRLHGVRPVFAPQRHGGPRGGQPDRQAALGPRRIVGALCRRAFPMRGACTPPVDGVAAQASMHRARTAATNPTGSQHQEPDGGNRHSSETREAARRGKGAARKEGSHPMHLWC
jgi:hypothetical protein